MGRKTLQISGGSFANLAQLSGENSLKDRELVLSIDTHELFVGDSEGKFHLAGQAQFGNTSKRLSTVALPGRFFYDEETTKLYLGIGSYESSEWTELTQIDRITKIANPIEGNLVIATNDGMVDDAGVRIDDTTVSSTAIWTSEKIKNYINDTIYGLSWEQSVKSIVSDEPANPSEGDRYLILNGVGTFLNKNNNIAMFNGFAWVYYTPQDSWALFVNDIDKAFLYTGSEWVEFASTEPYLAGDGISLIGKQISINLNILSSGLQKDVSGLKVKVDNESIFVDSNNNLTIKLDNNLSGLLNTADGLTINVGNGLKITDNTLSLSIDDLSALVVQDVVKVSSDETTFIINEENDLEVNAVDMGDFYLTVVQPSIIFPISGTTELSECPLLKSSEFQIINGDDAHQYTQWRIRKSTSTWQDPVWDSGITGDSLTAISLQKGYLEENTVYYAQVRHKGYISNWSEWSEEIQFTTRSQFVLNAISVFEFNTSLTDFISTGVASNDEFAATQDGDPVVLTYRNMTINAGHTVRPSVRCRGMFLTVMGDLIVNGTLTMTARGAYTPGMYVGVDLYQKVVYFNDVPDIYLPDFIRISATGGSGGARRGGGTSGYYNVAGIAGNAGVDGACGGGGSGACCLYQCTGYSGAGSAGTSFSGGSGGGAVSLHQSNATASTATSNGGPGSRGYSSWDGSHARGAGGGAGNNGGYTQISGAGGRVDGAAGTGGLMFIIVYGNIIIGPTGVISSDGSRGGYTNAAYEKACGGGSGGGSINLLYAGSYTNNGTVQANGGIGTYSGSYAGGTGGVGTIRIQQFGV